MALKPILKTKVDELFLRWLSDPDVQVSLKDSLHQIAKGELISPHVANKYPGSSLSRGSSPRLSSNSLGTGAASAKLPSPRSPRRPLSSKKFNGLDPNNKPSGPASPKDKDPAPLTASQPDSSKNQPVGGAKLPGSAQLNNHQRGHPKLADDENAHLPSNNQQQQQQHANNAQNSKDFKTPATGKASPKTLLVPGPNAATTTTTTATANNTATTNTNTTATTISSSTSPTSATTTTPEDPRAKRRSGGSAAATTNGRGGARVPTTGVPAGGVHIPQFYFPTGQSGPQSVAQVEAALQAVGKQFAGLEGGRAYKQQMGDIAKACGLPMYWKILVYRAAGGASEGYVTYNTVSAVVKKLFQTCHDDASRFQRLAGKPGSKILEVDDFDSMIQDVVETHPGLTFLQDAPEFHSRYVTTVAARIMFCINRSWSGKISIAELRKSNFLQTLSLLETEEDINQVKDFFSYEHFYVIYCKFWELDKDHDLLIDKNDLARHNDHALNSRLVDRIFSGAVTRGPDFQEGRMSYADFVWFLLAEEDKRHLTSIEYWFRCMDLDGDGVVSMYEMEYFHEEQMNKMETLGIERLPFEDTVCQMMDLVRPQKEGQITLRDLKACKMTNIFFDTFFNLDKFLEHEQRDPFANARDPNSDQVEVSDWNRFAEEEYDILVADEGSGDVDDGHYEDDFEPEDEDEVLREQMLRIATDPSPTPSVDQRAAGPAQDDIYDFSNSSKLGF